MDKQLKNETSNPRDGLPEKIFYAYRGDSAPLIHIQMGRVSPGSNGSALAGRAPVSDSDAFQNVQSDMKGGVKHEDFLDR